MMMMVMMKLVLMITITMMMLSRRTNNKKNAVAGAQVKQAASRCDCDAVVVALMNDLLLGASARYLSGHDRNPPPAPAPAEGTPSISLEVPSRTSLLELSSGRLGFAWQEH